MDQRPARSQTYEQILDIAQSLVQTRGYNAFSYADIATALNVTKASLHYHFPSKGDLGHSLIERYGQGFAQRLALIDATAPGAPDKIRAYVAIYAAVLADQRMCLCGMLAAEFATLPQAMQSALDQFFRQNEDWLEAVLDGGRRDGTLSFQGPAREAAQYIVAALEGAMMLARSHGIDERFHMAARRLLADVGI